MQKLLLILIVLIHSSVIFADTPTPSVLFQNHRESNKSIYFKRRTFFGRWLFKRRIKKAKKFFNPKRRKNFIETLSISNQKCEESFLTELNNFARIDFDEHRKRRTHLYMLRIDGFLDDIALGNLLKYSKYYIHPQSFIATTKFMQSKRKGDTAKALKIFVTKLQKAECLIPTLRSLTTNSKLPKKERKLIKSIKRSGIDSVFYKSIKKLIKKDFHKIRLSNSEYAREVRFDWEHHKT